METSEVIKRITARREKVASMLKRGWQSVTEITRETGYSDPRGYIRDLRDMGVRVEDEWRKGDGVRFKVYRITPEGDKRTQYTEHVRTEHPL
jgi:hypothetical protein